MSDIDLGLPLAQRPIAKQPNANGGELKANCANPDPVSYTHEPVRFCFCSVYTIVLAKIVLSCPCPCEQPFLFPSLRLWSVFSAIQLANCLNRVASENHLQRLAHGWGCTNEVMFIQEMHLNTLETTGYNFGVLWNMENRTLVATL